jgi:hypothetical protein
MDHARSLGCAPPPSTRDDGGRGECGGSPAAELLQGPVAIGEGKDLVHRQEVRVLEVAEVHVQLLHAVEQARVKF